MFINKIRDILALLNDIAPFNLSEDWDNSGLQVGRTSGEVKKVLIGLDVSLPLINFAVSEKVDLIITHHPLLLHSTRTIDFDRMPGKAVEIAAKQDITIVSLHTNIDKTRGGLNDYFASSIGIEKTNLFLIDPSVKESAQKETGIGRLGYLNTKITLKELVNQVKEKLNISYLRVTGDIQMTVETVVICTGSGGSLVEEFINSDADVFITGDVKYHEARRAEECSKGIIDVGHFASEWIVIDLLFERLNYVFHEAGLDIKIIKYKEEKDPFTIF